MLRSELYHALAESLAEPPEWMAAPGRDWPLFEIAARLAPQSEAARCAVASLGQIRAESLAARRARYRALFAGPGRPRFWLYESAYLTGRILGPETFAVEKLYRAAGLETAGGELPDHASLELAFLAHLAEAGGEAGGAGELERGFLRRHAGRWLPALGRGLARSGDEAYAPIGGLLADWLEECVECPVSGVGRRATRHSSLVTLLPHIPRAEACTLCGFCAQVCPTRALVIHETASETALLLNRAVCTACGRCERICERRALSLAPSVDCQLPTANWLSLRSSPRAACPSCGQSTISRAELDFVAAQIGHPAWLEYCLHCRPQLMENPR